VFAIEGVPFKTLLHVTCKAMDCLPNPIERKGAGRPRFDYRSRIAALIIKAWLKKPYRDAEVYLNDNKQILKEFNLKVPDHNTIWRTMTYLPETYLKELNQQITRLLKKEKNLSQ
jgi:hypothetical protein